MKRYPFHQRSLHLVVGILFTTGAALAQPEPVPDTAKIYRLGEVVVTEGRDAIVSPTTVQAISLARIDQTDAVSASELAYELPAARIQTNSRGEALLYIRNAGERQLALFFDGALMNVSWDNRIDMSLIPLNAIGGITLSKGVPSVLYGANVSGGAVNLVSQELRDTGSLTEFVGQYGQNNLLNGSLTHMANVGKFNYLASIGYTERDAVAISESADLPFNQSDPNARANSDSRRLNAYLRGEYHVDPGSAVGLSLSYIDGEKGVPPEGIDLDSYRFWRYPLWRSMNISINGDLRLSDDLTLRGALWGTTFRQTIDQYTSVDYLTRSGSQEDNDLTLGSRIVLRYDLGSQTLSLALNGLQATHDQRDIRFDSTGGTLLDSTGAAVAFPTLSYRQQIYSLGLEYENRLTDALQWTVGASFDGMATPETGGKPAQDGFSDYSVMTGLTYSLDDAHLLRASVGRKTRFPTMRELYGEALGRFVINPDLTPEDTWLGELGTEARYDWGNVSLVAFESLTSNTIDQTRRRDLPGSPRQRINLQGSYVIGGELTTAIFALRPLRLDGHFTYMYTRRRDSTGTLPDSMLYLAEKPEMLGTLNAEYDFPFGMSPSVELVYTGLAYGPDNDDVFVRLEPSLVINARLAYKLYVPFSDNFFAQLYVRVNNITDEVVTPQLGLPGAGREIQSGLKVTF